MAENQTSQTTPEEPPVSIRVEDAGPATKKVYVEIPRERVASRLEQQFKELRQDALIPGFRKGRVPQSLLRKRFGDDVKEQVRRTLIGESYEQAIKDNNLTVLGEPEFVNPDDIKLDDDAPLSYAFSVEVQPTFDLPELTGFEVKKPKIQITDEHIGQAMMNLREQQGTFVPVEDRGIQAKDLVVADVHVKIDGNVVSQQNDAQLVARPSRLAGFPVDDLDKQLEGAKPGETREVVAKVPDQHPVEALRGKEVHIEIAVKDIKRLEPAAVTKEFLEQLGFANEDELKQALREEMDYRINTDVQQLMRKQVVDQLVDKIQMELPAKLSDRQANRIVSRRAVALMSRGVPRERIEANIEVLRAGVSEEAKQELKRFFILSKVAEKLEIDVSEGELNNRVAQIAMHQGRRPERLKQDFAKDGTLANLYVQMREEKAVDKLMESAKIEEVEPTVEQQKSVVGTIGAEENQAAGAEPKMEQKPEEKKEGESPAT